MTKPSKKPFDAIECVLLCICGASLGSVMGGVPGMLIGLVISVWAINDVNKEHK
jgi:hypothetical protein